MVLENNYFVSQMLPGAIVRKLSSAELEIYSSPFKTPESRIPLLQWPREVPIDGKPQDVTEIVEKNSAWLKSSKVPKLLIAAEPGAIVPAALVEKVKAEYSNLTVKKVGAGIHYIQEDHPLEIGAAISNWITNKS